MKTLSRSWHGRLARDTAAIAASARARRACHLSFAIASLFVLVTVGCGGNKKKMQQVGDVGGGGADHRAVDLTVRDIGTMRLSQSLVGHTVRVQLRRDAMGMAGNTPLSTSDAWAQRLSLIGKVTQVTDPWLVIANNDAAGKSVYISQSAILLVELQD